MAVCYADSNRKAVKKLILLAPALNFENYTPPVTPISTPTLLVIGKHDIVTPPSLVLPLAEKTFTDLEVMLVDDDHMLHKVFTTLPWQDIVEPILSQL